jgi:hypothetical protein
MHPFEKIEATLAELGWTYDSHSEEFKRGNRRVRYQTLLRIMPGITLDDLVRYVDHKHEQHRKESR